MKRIDALIHPAQWEEARTILEALAVPVTLREVKTFGRTAPHRAVYRGSAYYTSVTPELELSALVEDHRLEAALAALERVVQNGEFLVSAVEGQVHRRALPEVVRAPQTAPVRPLVALPHAAFPRHA